MEKKSTAKTGNPIRHCLTFLLISFLMLFSKTSSAHEVLKYNVPCFLQGQTVTITPTLNFTGYNTYFHWQYRLGPSSSWVWLANGNNIINGHTFNLTGASQVSYIENYTEDLVITNVGTGYTTQLDNIEFRVLMTDFGLDPETNPTVPIYGGEEFGDKTAKYIRIRSKPVTESCYANCTENRLVVDPANPTQGTYYGGFEMQPYTSANFFTSNATTGATNAKTDLIQWTSASSVDKYRILNNPDSMTTDFTAFAPHSGSVMMVVRGNNSCTDRVWYRTITVPNVTQFFQGIMSFKAWFAKVDAGVNPIVVLEVKGASTTTSNTYTSISTVTQTVSGVAGAWVQLSMSISIPVQLYKKLEFSIKTSNGCTNAVSVAVDDICLLEPASGILPVVLTPLKGYYSNGVSHLTWSSLQESNSSHFEIERSSDGINYYYVAKVNAKGSSDRVVEYQFNDISVNSFNNYYRLKLYDRDGKFQYSNILLLTVRIKGTFITGIYPSPFTDRVNVNVTSEIKDNAVVVLYDNTGRQLASQTAVINKGVNTITLDKLAGLARGIYVIKVRVGEDIVLTQKLIK